MKPSLSRVAREVERWRHSLRDRPADVHRVPRPASLAALADADDEAYAHTEWADTEWPDTDLDPRPA